MKSLQFFLVLLLLTSNAILVSAEELRFSHEVEVLARQEMRKLVLSDLSMGQKKHFKIYMGVNAALNKGNFDSRKIFAAKYAPVFDSVEKHVPSLKNMAVRFRGASENALEKGNEKLALRCGKAADLYGKLLSVAARILEDRKYFNQSRMDKDLNDYRLVETELKYHRLKVPQRDWLTSQEAAKLISDWFKLKQSKKK